MSSRVAVVCSCRPPHSSAGPAKEWRDVGSYGLSVDLSRRFNVTESGVPDGPVVLMVHGFGCDQSMWRWMRLPFEATYRVISFDLIGFGGSDPEAYDPVKYESLEGYADDIVMLIEGLGLSDVTVVGHSVASMIAVLAAGERPDLIAALALLVPSARYIDDDEYSGGFTLDDIDDLMESLERNYLGWANSMAPVIMGRPDRPDLETELTELFCQADPVIATRFGNATFRSDNRGDLDRVQCPTLVVACQDDPIAPPAAVDFVANHIAGSIRITLDAVGHCPNLSAPEETAQAVLDFLQQLPTPSPAG